jgi:hypothetical protein
LEFANRQLLRIVAVVEWFRGWRIGQAVSHSRAIIRRQIPDGDVCDPTGVIDDQEGWDQQEPHFVRSGNEHNLVGFNTEFS